MIVAVPVSPFQHSPILGHCASSQTVWSLRDLNCPVKSSYLSPWAPRCLNQLGFLSSLTDWRLGPAGWNRTWEHSRSFRWLGLVSHFLWRSMKPGASLSSSHWNDILPMQQSPTEYIGLLVRAISWILAMRPTLWAYRNYRTLICVLQLVELEVDRLQLSQSSLMAFD